LQYQLFFFFATVFLSKAVIWNALGDFWNYFASVWNDPRPFWNGFRIHLISAFTSLAKSANRGAMRAIWRVVDGQVW
jgi:hypothetical protein